MTTTTNTNHHPRHKLYILYFKSYWKESGHYKHNNKTTNTICKEQHKIRKYLQNQAGQLFFPHFIWEEMKHNLSLNSIQGFFLCVLKVAQREWRILNVCSEGKVLYSIIYISNVTRLDNV